MAPPPSASPAVHPVVREVTEDTPPDLLEGTMDLLIVLPSGKTVQTTVDRKTPMMDLLIHAATANKINPAGHIVQVRNERGIEMPYKPSTPIGALDTTTIEIVPKNRVNEYIIVKKPAKVANQPFETTFRLQVHLPRNQLHVIRISPKTVLDDILREVCEEKNLDISKYELRHPVNLDQKLPLSATVGETGLQELTVVSKKSKINSSVSSADIIALQQSGDCRGKGCLDGSFKHSRSSVGDSSVSSESTASGTSGRGISPCRSEDSRSISPLPLIRPKTLFHSRTTSNISTCSSSGNSSGLHKSNSNTLNSSIMSSQISHQQVVMQAPPRTKKRAAPKPPSTPESSGVNPLTSPVSSLSRTCSTPLTESVYRANGTPSERPTPRKKEAPREPPKQHPPLSHHQSLPINHSRHNSGSAAAAECHQQPEVASTFQQNQNDVTQLDGVPHPASSTSIMSNKQSISSSMTNLTSVSSVSSTSLASSTGGSKKRRAPKPPVLATLNPPTQIEEETTATDSETSTLQSRDGGAANIVGKESVQVGKADVQRAGSPSSLSSPSTSGSTTPSPVPPATELSSPNKSTPSTVMMKGQRSANTNVGSGRDAENFDESGRSISRSSSTPSSNVDNNLVAPASPDSVRSRKLSSSNAVEVEETVTSSRSPSRNTQVSSSSSTSVSQGMPMPVPRKRAPTAPPTTENIPSNKTSSENVSTEDTSGEVAHPKPKPRPRSDRKSMESLISSASVIRPQQQQSKSLPPEGSGTSLDNDDTAIAPDPTRHPGQLRNPMEKYGVKVFPDNVLKERADKLRRKSGLPAGTAPSVPSNTTTTSTTAPANTNFALKDDAQSHRKPATTAKVPIHEASKSSSSYKSSSFDATEDYFDTGSITSFPANNIHTGKNSIGKSGLPPKPAPAFPKSDYTSQGSVRSLKQLTSAAGNSVQSSPNYNEKGGYESDDNLEENLDFFEPAHLQRARKNNPIPTATKPAVVEREKGSLIKSVSSQSAPTFPPTPRTSQEESQAEVAKSGSQTVAAPATKPQVVRSTMSAYEERDSAGKASMVKAKEDEENESNAKLNRWQNSVSLNEIESANRAGQMAKSASNRPAASSAHSQGSSNKPSFLHGGYQQRTNMNPSEESRNEVTCHSSESEASYTDSGVPATETVTPSPVNLDDVILDQEYHPGSHPEKFDGDEQKRSSRRSSIQSDHSEEWMHVLEAKMNKDEETIEKMFEAVLPKSKEGLSSKNQKEDGIENVPNKESEKKSPSQESNNKDKDMSLELDYKEIDKARGNDRRSELIETTVQLHQSPETEDPIEPEEDKQPDSITSSTSDSTLPVRKLSKSESFSHNGELDEAKEKRKNFHTGRSNAFQTSSAGSATDLRDNTTLSDSEEESGESQEKKVYEKNLMQQQSTHVREVKTVSMNDLTSGRDNTDSLETDEDDKGKKSLEHQAPSVQKATSLQQLPENKSTEENAEIVVDVYKKQLEMQFEQWKEEFMKQQHTKDEIDASPNSAQVDQAGTGQSEQQVEEEKLNDNDIDSHDDEIIRVVPDNTHQLVQTSENTGGEDSSTVVEESAIKAGNDEQNEGSTIARSPTTVEREAIIDVQEKSTQESPMNRTEDFTTVELRKKESKPRTLPDVVYQYAGPPKIKMSAWDEGPRRQVSVKTDSDYIMGFGQQDPSTKAAANPTRIHSFHGGPVVPIAQPSTENKIKRESSPSGAKGWSAAINAPNIMPGSTGAVRSVLSTWKQKMEETEKEKTKPKGGPPPAEIDIYGSENNVEIQKKPVTQSISNGFVTKNNNANTQSTENKTVVGKRESFTIPIANGNAIKQMDPKPASTPPKVAEKSMTLGSSFRTDKPVIFTMSHMDSNTIPRNKSSPTPPKNNSVDIVDSKPTSASSTVELTTSGSLQDKKKFFQGVKPVENGKEAPIPAANMKSNIATIQKVFEKQRMTKMQQMGSQQSLYSDGTTSPVPGLQRNDSLESRQSNNTLQRRNSIESHSSDSSSVVLRVSQNSSGKGSPQLSGNEMVQKLFGRPNSYNVEISRRTPSPISSTTSTLSSSASYDRFTPSPTVIDGPNNSVRITTGGYKPANNQSPNIRSVGNKAIITVNGEAGPKTPVKDSLASRKDMTAVNDNIVLNEKSKKVAVNPSVMSTYVSVINQQQQQQPKRDPIVQIKNDPVMQTKRESIVVQDKRDSVVENKRNSIVQNKRESFLLPDKRDSILQNKRESVSVTPSSKNILNEPKIIEKNARNVQSNGVPPPPPPPPVDGIISLKPSLSLDVKKTLPTSNNGSSPKSATPTSPSSPDPRSEINNAIKNSNGNFGLRKTGSSILLK